MSTSALPLPDTCKTPSCTRPRKARGFCNTCYTKGIRNGSIVTGTPTEHRQHRISNVDETARTGDCAMCGKVRVYQTRDRRHWDNPSWICAIGGRHCRGSKSRQSQPIQLLAKLTEVKTACEICGEGSDETLAYDHCHKTSIYRGMLCKNCNWGLGSFQDSTELLHRAIEYLHRTDPTIALEQMKEPNAPTLDLTHE